MNLFILTLLYLFVAICFCARKALFELEAHQDVGHLGQPLWFYVRFSQTLFVNEPHTVFYVQVFSNDKGKTVEHCMTLESDQQKLPTELPDGTLISVKPPFLFRHIRLFQFTLSEHGNYTVYVRPNVTRSTESMMAQKIAFVNFRVSRLFDSNKCLETASFSINDIDVVVNSRDLPLFSLDTPIYLWLKFQDRECYFDKKINHTWTIERVIQSVRRPGVVPKCMNNKRVGRVDLTKLMSKMTSFVLPVSMTQHTLFIQPYTFAPASDYRICVLLTEGKVGRTLCSIISTNETEVDGLLYAIVVPPMSRFTWGSADLIINASRSFFFYELDEAGFTGRRTLTFQWTCAGDVRICELIRRNQGFRTVTTGNKTLESSIQNWAKHILIRKEWLRPPAQFTVTLTLSAKFQNRVYQEVVDRTIRIPEHIAGPQSVPHIFIRCLRNCQYFLNVDYELHLGFGCKNCEEITRRDFTVKWSSPNLTSLGGTIMNATSIYPSLKLKPSSNRADFRVVLTFNYSQGFRKILSAVSRCFRVPAFNAEKVIVTKREKTFRKLWEEWRELTSTSVSDSPSSRLLPSVTSLLPASEAPRESKKPIPDAAKKRGARSGTGGEKSAAFISFNMGTVQNLDRYRIAFEPHNVTSVGSFAMFPAIYCLHFEVEDNVKDNVSSWFRLLALSTLEFYAIESLNSTVRVHPVTSFGAEIETPNDTLPMRENTTLVNYSDAFHKYFTSNDPDVTQLMFLICSMIDSNLNSTMQMKFIDLAQRHLKDRKKTLINYSNFTVVLFILERMFQVLKKLVISNLNITSVFLPCDSSDHYLDIIMTTLDIYTEQIDYSATYERERVFGQMINLLDDIKHDCKKAYGMQGHQDLRHLLKVDSSMIVGTHIFMLLEVILQYCSDKLDDYPLARSSISCTSFDASTSHLLEVGGHLAHVHVDTSDYFRLLDDISVDPHINMAVYASNDSSLKNRMAELDINCPVLLISIRQMSPLDYYFKEFATNIFDIRLKPTQVTGTVKNFTIQLQTIESVGKKLQVMDGDCLLLKLNASVLYATQLTLKSSSHLNYLVTAMQVKYTSDVLSIIGRPYKEVPRSSQVTYGQLKELPNTIFLPQLSSQNLLSRNSEYYVLIRVKTATAVVKEDSDVLSVGCVRITCVHWSSEHKSWSTKNCRPTNMSLGTPKYVNCKCDTGKVFSGGTQDCSQVMEAPWRDYSTVSIQWDDVIKMQSTYWYYVVLSWLVFSVALVWAYDKDKKERPLGGVHVLPELYSPYQADQYLVCIVTGWMFGAGTNTTPMLTLTDNNECGIYLLFPDKSVFQSGTEVWFLLSCPDDVKMLDKVILSFGSAHYIDDWHVSHIYMRHLKRDQDFYCICDSWIPDLSNGLRFIVKPVTVTPGSAMRNFALNVIRMFRTLHVFIGTFYSVPGSNFTKTQHALCLLFTVILNMFVCLSVGDDARLELLGDRNLRKPERNLKNFSTIFIITLSLTSLVSFAVVSWFEILNYYSLSDIRLRWQHNTAIDYRRLMVDSLTTLGSESESYDRRRGLPGRFQHSRAPSFVPSHGSKVDRSLGTPEDEQSASHEVYPNAPGAPGAAGKMKPSELGLSLPAAGYQGSRGNASDATGRTGRTAGVRSKLAVGKESKRTSLRRRTLANLESFWDEKGVKIPGSTVDVHDIHRSASMESQQDHLTDFMSNMGVDENISYHINYSNFVPAAFQILSCAVLVVVTIVFSVQLVYVSLNVKDTYRVDALMALTLASTVLVIHPILILVVTAMLTKRGLLDSCKIADRKLQAIKSQLVYNLKFAKRPTTETSRYVPRDRCYFRRKKKTNHRHYCQLFIKKYGITSDALGIFSVTHFSKRKSQFLFIVLVVIIINVQIGSVSDRYMQTSYIRRMLKVGRNEMKLKQCLTVNDVWKHIRGHMHLMTYWILFNVNTTSSFHVLSSTRIRQVRVLHDQASCKYLLPVNDTLHCHYDIEESTLDTRTYAWCWQRPAHRTTTSGPFTFTEGQPFETSMHSYPGGGYDIIVSATESTPTKIDRISSRMWVDDRTRAIKVDLAVFNADTQLVTSVSHVYEFTGVGIFQNTIRVFSFSLFYTTATAEFLRLCLFLMVLSTFYFAVKEIIQLRSSGVLKYFSEPMAWLNLLERQTCVAIFVGFVVQIVYRQDAVTKVRSYFSTSEDQRSYFDFSNVSDIDNTITNMCCILAMVSFIKILVQTSNLASMSQFLELIPPALKISYLVVIAVITYASCGYFFFTEIDDFSTFPKSVYTVTELVINPGLMNSMASSYRVIAPVYITVTMSIMNYVIINYFITLLNEEYSRICTAMRMRMEGKKAFLLEEVLKYVFTQKAAAFREGEVKDVHRKDERRQVKDVWANSLGGDQNDFDLFKWASETEV